MNNKIISLVISLLYIPLVFIGQFIGNIIGKLIFSIMGTYWFSFIINYLSEIIHMFVGGIIGGFFSGFIIFKIYKSFNFLFVSIIPWVVSILYIVVIFFIGPNYLQTELDIVAFGDAAATLLSILFFHFYLKNKSKG